jgi:hypothetical protein
VPNVLSTPWYAQVKDHFTIELPDWRVHNNGCVGSCTNNLSTAVRYYFEGKTTSVAGTRTTYTGRDAGNASWGGKTLPFSVERRDGACFDVYMSATESGLNWNELSVAPRWCYKASTMDWVPTSGGAIGIGASHSIYAKESTDFDYTFRFRIRWSATIMDGLLLQNANNPFDGPEWHHLPIRLWNNPPGVLVWMDNSDRNADLYTSLSYRPTLTFYDCRPGERNPSELCEHTGMTTLWTSVRNVSSDFQSKYTLGVYPRY